MINLSNNCVQSIKVYQDTREVGSPTNYYMMSFNTRQLVATPTYILCSQRKYGVLAYRFVGSNVNSTTVNWFVLLVSNTHSSIW